MTSLPVHRPSPRRLIDFVPRPPGRRAPLRLLGHHRGSAHGRAVGRCLRPRRCRPSGRASAPTRTCRRPTRCSRAALRKLARPRRAVRSRGVRSRAVRPRPRPGRRERGGGEGALPSTSFLRRRGTRSPSARPTGWSSSSTATRSSRARCAPRRSARRSPRRPTTSPPPNPDSHLPSRGPPLLCTFEVASSHGYAHSKWPHLMDLSHGGKS